MNVLGNDARAAENSGATPLPPLPVPALPGENEADRIERRVSTGLLNSNYAAALTIRQQSALRSVDGLSDPTTPPLFPNLPDVLSRRVIPAQPMPHAHQAKYLLRTDLGTLDLASCASPLLKWVLPTQQEAARMGGL
ncbi:hypothetical protein [Neotabrizicola shimadae]|uniref:Uncharacterized protein n=1 Tax=Neotabrizicola shimadae TaxID=2807096 RepID=A0A8G0ZP34_9RHOB|nr:hypothetical protein [Neotabrizicola shimadae]QYZ68896.1 hypothetical protein JO391_14180 [Neotabrizicola shimadae]